MDRKRIQCLSNTSQHVPIYIQRFLRYRYSGISVASDWFSTVLVGEWAFLTTFCFPLGTFPDNLGKCYTDRKRIQWLSMSNVSQHVPIYLQAVKFKGRHFSTFFAHFASPGYAPGTIAVNACQTHLDIYLQPFTSYSEIFVGNRNFFLPPCILRPRT